MKLSLANGGERVYGEQEPDGHDQRDQVLRSKPLFYDVLKYKRRERFVLRKIMFYYYEWPTLLFFCQNLFKMYFRSTIEDIFVQRKIKMIHITRPR